MMTRDEMLECLSYDGSELDLSYREVTTDDLRELAPHISELENLEWLDLGHNQISEVAPLVALTNLAGLYLEHNQIGEVAPLVALTNLAGLYLEHNQIGDASALVALRSALPRTLVLG